MRAEDNNPFANSTRRWSNSTTSSSRTSEGLLHTLIWWLNVEALRCLLLMLGTPYIGNNLGAG